MTADRTGVCVSVRSDVAPFVRIDAVSAKLTVGVATGGALRPCLTGCITAGAGLTPLGVVAAVIHAFVKMLSIFIHPVKGDGMLANLFGFIPLVKGEVVIARNRITTRAGVPVGVTLGAILCGGSYMCLIRHRLGVIVAEGGAILASANRTCACGQAICRGEAVPVNLTGGAAVILAAAGRKDKNKHK